MMTRIAYYDTDDEEVRRRFRAQAFVTGYHHGCLQGTHAAPREVWERFPNWANAQIECYLNGRDDGIAGDSTRFVKLRDEQ